MVFLQLSSDDQVNKPATKELFREKVFVEEEIKETADKVLDRCLTTGTGKMMISYKEKCKLNH